MARSLAATARVLKPGAVVPAAPIGRPDTAVEAYSYRVPVAPPRRAYVRSCPCAERKHVLARTYVPNANGTFHSRFTPVLSGRRAFDAAVHVGHAARAPSSRSASSAQARPPGQKRSCGHASRWLGSSGSDPSGGGAGAEVDAYMWRRRYVSSSCRAAVAVSSSRVARGARAMLFRQPNGQKMEWFGL